MKVVITGMGLVSCLANNVDQFWTNIKNGNSGIDRISLVSPDPFPCKVAGEIKDFSIDHIVSNKESRRMARFTQYAIHATDQALKDSTNFNGGKTFAENSSNFLCTELSGGK